MQSREAVPSAAHLSLHVPHLAEHLMGEGLHVKASDQLLNLPHGMKMKTFATECKKKLMI